MQIKQQSQLEFIALMASLMSLVALSIDALLPALNEISISVGITDAADNQLLITMIFLGLGFGQLIFGPLSDSFGRKPVIYIGFIVFIMASIICITANSLETMIAGRILQGIGLSAPRTISIAMVRDSYSGNYMAKIMSFIVVIFLLIPTIAPAIGKFLLNAYGWRFIFNSQLIYGSIIMFWLWKRQPETLQKQNRTPFKLNLYLKSAKEFFKHKQAIIFTCISGFIMGSFMVYLSTTEHIFRTQYNLADEFTTIFAGLALSVGLATFLNGAFVMKFGMLKLVKTFTLSFTLISLVYCLLYFRKPNPSIYILIFFFGIQFFSIGFLFGNLRALAMQPIGHIAGMGAAINGFLSTVMAVSIATFIGKFINITALPLFIGFMICGTLSLILLGILNFKWKQ